MTLSISVEGHAITAETACGPCAREIRAGTTGYEPRHVDAGESLPAPGSGDLCRRCGVRLIGAEPPS